MFQDGLLNVKSATPYIVGERAEQVEELWRAVVALQGFGEPGAKTKTVVAQSVVLKALAKLTFDLLFSNRRPPDGEALFAHLVTHLKDVDFSHDNKMWRFYQLTEQEKADPEIAALADYLPNRGVETANRKAELSTPLRAVRF